LKGNYDYRIQLANCSNVTEEMLLNWCWANSVDKDAIEVNLATQIETQKNPVTATGVPW
jgi:hypothetical protein